MPTWSTRSCNLHRYLDKKNAQVSGPLDQSWMAPKRCSYLVRAAADEAKLEHQVENVSFHLQDLHQITSPLDVLDKLLTPDIRDCTNLFNRTLNRTL